MFITLCEYIYICSIDAQDTHFYVRPVRAESSYTEINYNVVESRVSSTVCINMCTTSILRGCVDGQIIDEGKEQTNLNVLMLNKCLPSV